MWNKLKTSYREKPNRTMIAGAVLASIAVFAVLALYDWICSRWTGIYVFGSVVAYMVSGVLFSLIVYPFVLTLQNLCQLFNPHITERNIRAAKITDRITILWGAFCVVLYGSQKVKLEDYPIRLVNDELHTPVATWTLPTVLTLAAIGLLGYLILLHIPLEKLPPLACVLALTALYLGMGLCLLFAIQLAGGDWLLFLYPANLLLVSGKTVRHVCSQHERARGWPWLALCLMWPLLGAAVALLILFGQKPDSIIQAWTQTSDWTLSLQQAPPNVYKDMDYLCTVAAGGHPKVVRPVRMGERNGRRIVVNRQLLVTNAFEELLEERLPKVHRLVRGIYDAAGYPLAKRVRSRWAADVVYVLMKPMEGFCLLALYLFDPKPEDRIAMQYAGRTRQEWIREIKR